MTALTIQSVKSVKSVKMCKKRKRIRYKTNPKIIRKVANLKGYTEKAALSRNLGEMQLGGKIDSEIVNVSNGKTTIIKMKNGSRPDMEK